MARHIVTFTGDPKGRHNPEAVTFRGVEFPFNQPVPIDAVSAEAQAMIRKLRGNSHFRVEDFVEPEPEPVKAKGRKDRAPEPAPEPDA